MGKELSLCNFNVLCAQVIPEWALENSGKRVPFPINVVCKGENEGGPTPPENREDLLSLGGHTLNA